VYVKFSSLIGCCGITYTSPLLESILSSELDTNTEIHNNLVDLNAVTRMI